MAEINVGQISEALNNKADLDLNNTQPFADYVVEWKAPTSSDQSWYRLYKSGWVEQGGYNKGTSGAWKAISLAKTMSNNLYSITTAIAVAENNDTNFQVKVCNTTTTSFDCRTLYSSGNAGSYYFYWEVKGFAAQS